MSVPLPEEWKITNLSDVILKIVGGGTPSKSQPSYYKGDIPWMTVKDMNKFLLEDTVDHITQEAVKKSSTRIIPAGTPIIATRMSLGKIVRAKFDSAINQDLKGGGLQPQISGHYFEYWYRSIAPHILSVGKGTIVKGVRLEQVNSLQFPLASQAEQKQIAAKLDELLAQVDTLKTRLDTIPTILKRFRQSVLASAVNGKLTKQWRNKNLYINEIGTKDYIDKKIRVVEPKEIYSEAPKQWIWNRFGNHVNLVNGDRGKNYPNKSEYVDKGIPFINTGHIDPDGTLSEKRMNYITQEKFNSLGSGKIQTDDLVYCLRGATMGKTAMVDTLKEGAIASSLVIIRPKYLILSKFVFIFLISPQGKELILRYDNGSAQPNLSAKSLSLFPLALPPIEEQFEIVQRVEQLFTFADKIEQRVKDAQSKVNNITQSILAKAFRGELTEEWRKQNPDLISRKNSAKALLEKIKAEREQLIPKKRAVKKKNKAKA